MISLRRPITTVFFTIVVLSLGACGSTTGHVGVSSHYGHDPFYHPHWHDGGDVIVVPPPPRPPVRPPRPPRPPIRPPRPRR